MIGAVLRWLTGGALDRALGTVDRYIESQTDREKIKGDLLKAHLTTRADWLRAGGFWLLAAFAAPVWLHFGAVVAYSIFWCRSCAFPQDWTIAALPGAMQQWEGWILLASIGGLSLLGMRR